MQPIQRLMRTLAEVSSAEHYLFALTDLRAAVPDISDTAFRNLLSRAVRGGLLTRACRGLYLHGADYPCGLVLFHAAARLRADAFNYLSLETILSEAGVISQLPINWITLMSSSRSSVIRCGDWGTIEYVHTDKPPDAIEDQLQYDRRYGLWRASVALAMQDMRATRRNLDLVDKDAFDELV